MEIMENKQPESHTHEYKDFLLIKYGENSLKIQKRSDKPISIRTFRLKLSYDSALKLLNEEYVLVTNDYFFKKFQVSDLLVNNKLLIKSRIDMWEVDFKEVDGQVLIKKDEYLKIVYRLVESEKLGENFSEQVTESEGAIKDCVNDSEGAIKDSEYRSMFTDIKYFKKKLDKRMKSISVSFLTAYNFHLVMQMKYDSQICWLTPVSLSYMLLFLIDLQPDFHGSNNKNIPLIGVLDDVKGVLAFSIKERLEYQKTKTKYFSKNAHKFTYDSKIHFESTQNIQMNENFDIFFIASSINKVNIMNSVCACRFVMFISNITELQEVTFYLFENTDKFTDIVVKELLNREIEVTEYGSMFIHPQIKGRLGNGYVISFSPVSLE